MMEGPQWLEERRRGIGGSDVAAIMGLSPWKTAYRVYQEKRREVEDWQGNESTDWGKRMEPAIRQWYSDQTGRVVRVPDGILYHCEYPFMFASLDGFTEDGRGVEIKTARSSKGWGEPGTNEIPDYYTLQVQHYMCVTGFDVFDVPVSIGGASPVLYEVPADRELQELIVEAEAEFWQRVTDGNPPAPVTYADAIQRFGKSSGSGAVIARSYEVSAVEMLRDVRNQINDLQTKEEALKANLIISLGDCADTLVDDGGNTLVTYKLAAGRSSFDTKGMAKDHPAIYNTYLKQGEPSRRFLLR